MRSLVRLTVLLALACAGAGRIHATGYYGEDHYLDQGGRNVDNAPEFYWDIEVKRIARDFHPQEKLRRAAKEDLAGGGKGRDGATAAADGADFAAALREGRTKPPDPAGATAQHENARRFISTTDEKTAAPLPEEFASEFADYHRGAFAYRSGRGHWEEARRAWLALLERPPAERHYRTVWATFMLGKLTMKSAEPEAVKWFERTRAVAAEGFADSLGMAADSYGWQGRSEWKQDHVETAASLFLTQLALGDESGVVSLKALIPDRAPVDGMLNYGPESEEKNARSDEEKRAAADRELTVLRRAAADPLLRRLVTAHILATGTGVDFYGQDSTTLTARSTRWLKVINEAKLGEVPDAEYLGWTAYNNGNYKEAARWLAIAKADAPASAWLRAKLQRREGKLREAAESMEQAWQSIHHLSDYTSWTAKPEETNEEFTSRDGPSWPFDRAASGDLAALRLVRGDFVQALETFLDGGLRNDAAYLAERVLSAEELKKYVDQAEGDDLHYLLGRRLVREDRYEEAARYLRAPYDKIVQRYAAALREGADVTLEKTKRAEGWFRAAWLARHDGMELMGTEVAPDVFVTGGAFPINDLAKERLSGRYEKIRYTNEGEMKETVPISLKPSKMEVQRLTRNRIVPDVRFHYRVVAASLAMKAAELLPDNSDELTDVINTAGRWVKDRDEPLARKYFHELERRCSRAELGRAPMARHWFVDQSGPWSAKQDEDYKAMHQELGDSKSAP